MLYNGSSFMNLYVQLHSKKVSNKTSEKNKFCLVSQQSKITKGQLISKCHFGLIVWTKIPTKIFLDFCPEFFVASWGLHGSSLGFLGT